MKPLGTALGDLLNKPTSGSVQRASADRMMLSEALEAVGRMIDCCPHQARSSLTDSYIGNMAALLCEFPRSVATQCADPLHGVLRETKFLPTVHDVVKWCEPRAADVREREDREEAARQQLRERRAYDAKKGPPSELPKFSRANLLVRPGRPGYEQMVERSKHSSADEFSWVPEGIWVPVEWYHERHGWRPRAVSAAA